jgi:hypothetical protein
MFYKKLHKKITKIVKILLMISISNGVIFEMK